MMFAKRRRRKRVLTVYLDNGVGVVEFVKKMKHRIEIPADIAEWAKKNQDILDWLVFDSPIASALRHPHSVRTLIFLLYARANDIPIAQIAKKLDIAHEQLYRLERLLVKTGIKEMVYAMLKTKPQQV